MSISTSNSLLPAGESLDTASSRDGNRILFVSENRGYFASLQSFVERRGGDVFHARSASEGLARFGAACFDLILDMTPFQSDHRALAALGRAECSIFRCCQVEIGSLWLPVVLRGQRCFGSAALRPKEFIAALEKAICEPATMKAGRS